MKKGTVIVYKTPKRFLAKAVRDPSSWALLLSNLFTGILAVMQNWSLGNLLWVYLGQSIIIGLFSFLKLLIFRKSIKKNKKFFIIHYFFPFFLVHGIYSLFIIFFFSRNLEFIYILIGIGIFFLNHSFSFFYNYSQDKKRIQKEKNEMKLLSAPYARTLPIHLTILVGMFGISFFIDKYQITTLVVFLILKIYIDILVHVSEHNSI